MPTAWRCALILGLRYRNRLAPPEMRRSWLWSFLPLALANAVAVGLPAAVLLQAVFNATLIISGMLMIVLQQFFMDDFIYLRSRGLLTRRKTQLVRGSLIALGVLMAIVGIIPFGVDDVLNNVHSFAAYGLALILLAHMILVRRLLLYFSREFYATSWVAVVLLVAVVTLHLTGSINTVGVELLAFAIGGA